MPKKTNNQNLNKVKSHKVRTFFSSIFGIIAVYLILASLTVVWLNRTVTDTPTYVNTVAPLVTKPAIQNYISQKVTDQILNNAPIQDMANSLLPASQLAGNPTPMQLKTDLTPIIQNSVNQIVKSNSFAVLWKTTNQTAHAALITQINNNSNQIQLNLSPAVNGVINDLKTTNLSVVANKINVSPNAGNLDIKSSGISKVHKYYKLFQTGTIAIVLAALLAFVISILLSVHHMKTTRRILFGVGIIALIQAVILEVPAVIKAPGQDQVTQDAIKAFAQAIFHNLQLASFILGILCILLAVGSKIYENRQLKKFN